MKRILVIEDEPQMLLGLRDNLELEGYEVATAADGDEGLQKAATFHANFTYPDGSVVADGGKPNFKKLQAIRLEQSR